VGRQVTTLERLAVIVAECERLRLRPTSLKVTRMEFAHVRHHLRGVDVPAGHVVVFCGVPLRVVRD
jgi:hypothetical protein